MTLKEMARQAAQTANKDFDAPAGIHYDNALADAVAVAVLREVRRVMIQDDDSTWRIDELLAECAPAAGMSRADSRRAFKKAIEGP